MARLYPKTLKRATLNKEDVYSQAVRKALNPDDEQLSKAGRGNRNGIEVARISLYAKQYGWDLLTKLVELHQPMGYYKEDLFSEDEKVLLDTLKDLKLHNRLKKLTRVVNVIDDEIWYETAQMKSLTRRIAIAREIRLKDGPVKIHQEAFPEPSKAEMLEQELSENKRDICGTIESAIIAHKLYKVPISWLLCLDDETFYGYDQDIEELFVRIETMHTKHFKLLEKVL